MKHISKNIDAVILASKHSESPIETLLFQAFMRSEKFVLCKEGDDPSGEGLFLFPQFPIGKYRSDFLIKVSSYIPRNRVWPPKLKSLICVECDGHDFHTTPEQIEYDTKRDEYYLENGIKTFRYTGSEISKDPDFIVQDILHKIHMHLRGA